MIRILTVAHPGDEVAARTHAILRQRLGASAVSLLAAEQITLASEWRHMLRQGKPISRLILSDGSLLDFNRPFLVFNRMRQVSLPSFAGAEEGDRIYAMSEMHALLLSWLYSFRQWVVNPPMPPGLHGPQLGRLDALHAAAKAGLPVIDYSFSTEPRHRFAKGFFPYRKIPSQMVQPERELCAMTSPVLGREPLVGVDCRLEDETLITFAGRHASDNRFDRYTEAVGGLQRLMDCPLLELSFVKDANKQPKVSNVSAFPNRPSSQSAQAIAHYFLEKMQEMGVMD